MRQNTSGQDEGHQEQALIVWIRLSDAQSGTKDEREKIFKLEDEVMERIEKSGAGVYDGNEIGEGFFTMYMYGKDASRLWDVALPLLKRFQPPVGSYAIKRYGKPGARQDRTTTFE